MTSPRGYIYAGSLVAAAVAYSIWGGRLWMTDAGVLAAVAAGVVYFGLVRGPRTAITEPEPREQMPRSRIAHYVLVCRIKKTKLSHDRSDSPFEDALFSDPGWRGLSEDALRDVASRAAGAGREPLNERRA